MRHAENAKASPESCYIRCARYNDKIVVPVSDVLILLPYIFGRGLSDEERGAALATLASCSFRELRKNVHEKMFGEHADQTTIFQNCTSCCSGTPSGSAVVCLSTGGDDSAPFGHWAHGRSHVEFDHV